jgi:UDP-3-O-[3-hydroxymyristoyl] glucosamine N-acyltransferase LpxD
MPDFEYGENLQLGKYVTIEKGCQIGNNVIVEDFVVLKSDTIIGDDCCIHAGAKIGTAPFSFEEKKGIRKRKHHTGITVIMQGVDIGFNTVIQRGVEGNTVIGAFTFINNLCNIGHDVQIGDGCTIGMGASMSGYTEIGSQTYISPGVTILNRVKIGNNSMVGIGSLVLHSIGDDTTVTGRPAVDLGIYKAERKALKRLLNVSQKTSPIATKKGMWARRLKKKINRIFN